MAKYTIKQTGDIVLFDDEKVFTTDSEIDAYDMFKERFEDAFNDLFHGEADIDGLNMFFKQDEGDNFHCTIAYPLRRKEVGKIYFIKED